MVRTTSVRWLFALTVLAVAGLLVAAPLAQAGQVTLKLATSQPPKGGFLGETPKIFADEVENASVTLNYLLARNLRLSGEVEHDLNAESSRVSVGFITAF